MARFEKGYPRLPGAGRSKGSPNRATRNAREAIARFVDENAPRLQAWLDQIVETEGPLAAFRCVHALIEYHIPKLGRAELTINKGSEEKGNVIDASKLTWAERQQLRAIILAAAARERGGVAAALEAQSQVAQIGGEGD